MNLFHQDPDSNRSRGKHNENLAPGVREDAKGDPGWEAELYRTGGYGIHAFAVVQREVQGQRGRDLNWTADGHEGAATANYTGATDFEHNDIEGGARVNRVVKDE